MRDASAYGVLKLTLDSTSYSWQFAPAAGQTFTDSGTASCVTASANRSPTVNAGPDQMVTLPASASLDGTVFDDLPNPPGALTASWSMLSGPGTVTFGDASAVDTSASFSVAGSYQLQLQVSDGALSASDTLTVTVNPAPNSDLIFVDGFESGNLSAWTSATTDGGNLGVSTAAALAGTNGLQALINDNHPIFVADSRPTAESRYRARFYFDPNSILMAKNNAHFIFEGRTASGTRVLRVEFRWTGTQYQIRAALVQDTTSFTNTAWSAITDAPHPIEIDWQASTAPGANNGGLTLWIDGAQKATLTGVDNDTRRVDEARLGPIAGLDNGTRGTYYFDSFESHRLTYIGP